MKFVAVIVALAVVLAVLIVVNAPPSDDALTGGGTPVPIEAVFAALEAENDMVRQVWASDIVGAGQVQGIRFDEAWHDEGLDAGPLPALFLRETAEGLRRSPAPLYLFLGSDFPINDANRFTGSQMEYFDAIKRTGEPQFFLDPDIGFQTAMFSDIASAEACVVCHNRDPNSPKTDWQVGDVMGATTWSYPEDEISMAQALELIGALRRSVREAYVHYLEKVATFADPPRVGDQWPAEGYFLPSADIFMAEVEERTSAQTLRLLLEAQGVGDAR